MGMTNAETKKHLLTEAENMTKAGVFHWVTDAYGYDQHIKFVRYRNKYWKGGDFKQFVIDYANSLDT